MFGADTPPASILLTHSHLDHDGAALPLARLWNCPVYLHPDELPLATGDLAAITASGGPLDNCQRWKPIDRSAHRTILAPSTT